MDNDEMQRVLRISTDNDPKNDLWMPYEEYLAINKMLEEQNKKAIAHLLYGIPFPEEAP